MGVDVLERGVLGHLWRMNTRTVFQSRLEAAPPAMANPSTKLGQSISVMVVMMARPRPLPSLSARRVNVARLYPLRARALPET